MALVPYRRADSRSLIDELFRMPELWEDTLSSVRGAVADVYETPEAVVVEMAVPGVKPGDISINVTGDTLTISGQNSRSEKEENSRSYYQKQIRYGSFAQSVTLPSSVQSDKAEATFTHGILKVTLPKSEEAKPRKIEVKVQEGK